MPPTSASNIIKTTGDKSYCKSPMNSSMALDLDKQNDGKEIIGPGEKKLSNTIDCVSIKSKLEIENGEAVSVKYEETRSSIDSNNDPKLESAKNEKRHVNEFNDATSLSVKKSPNDAGVDKDNFSHSNGSRSSKKCSIVENGENDSTLGTSTNTTLHNAKTPNEENDLKMVESATVTSSEHGKTVTIEKQFSNSIVGGSVNNQEPECFFCGIKETEDISLKLCEFCNDVYYCGSSHFEYHRPEVQCYPYIIKHAPGVGRFMVASRDINPLELILKEHPAVVGPYTNTLQGCLQCFRKVDGSYKCTACGFPMCNSKCQNGYLHREECQFFQKQNFGLSSIQSALLNPKTNNTSSTVKLFHSKPLFTSKRIPVEATALAAAAASLKRAKADQLPKNGLSHNDAKPKSSNDTSAADIDKNALVSTSFRKQIPTMLRSSSSHVCITPLRMLLKRNTDPKAFEKISMLQDHLEERNDKYQNVGIQMLNVVMLLQEACSEPQFTNEEIQRMIGILRTNGMKLLPHGTKSGIQGVALYPIYCLINHACYNNTNYVKYPDYHLEVRSQLPIKKGEEIYTRYISSTIGNFRRREDIRKYWFFDCRCNRCTDRTEFGTNMSAVLCLKCKKGYLLPLNSLEYKSDWTCDNCHISTKYEMIDEIVTTIEDEVGELTQSNKSISDMERMLHCFSNVLHPNHYILIDIMHNLVHLYAAKKTLTRPEKERKIQICFNVIDVLGVVDPGYTKWRGTLLQELIHPLMQITKRDHDLELISPQEFRRRLDFCTRNLNTAKKCIRGGFMPIEDFLRQQKCASDAKWETEDLINAIGNITIAHKTPVLN